MLGFDRGWRQFVWRAPRQKPRLHGFVVNNPASPIVGLRAGVRGGFGLFIDFVENRGFGVRHIRKLTQSVSDREGHGR